MLRFADAGRTVIDTCEGPVGLAWSPRGATRLVLPGGLGDRDRAAVLAALPADQPLVPRPGGWS
ncbi:MAG: hypothetical protein IH621_12745, partial [Krumholzibacteria bacterium]|nr:hypothetical protein [Candidatus Krumholzibacteria bacterium]